jgi:hypothetical protein
MRNYEDLQVWQKAHKLTWSSIRTLDAFLSRSGSADQPDS